MSEDLKPTVSEMIRLTSTNTSEFLKQIADHIDKLEEHVVQLTNRINDLESKTDDIK
jgi:ubiquinone biosynthesis protein UbiJ